MSKVNHWGVTVDSNSPTTGVLSTNSIQFEFIDNEICLTCEGWIKDIEARDDCPECESRLTDDSSECPECGWTKERELDSIECNSSHDKIIGDWKIDTKTGKYEPDEMGEYAAIENESTIQVVWSKFTALGALCSPCFPGQVDLDSTGQFLGYTLPDYMLYKG